MTDTVQADADGDFTTETKYKQFSYEVERALRNFELSTEWPDLISALTRLNKVFMAYTQYPDVPHKLTVSKRLSQCLHPNLPSGVHLKVLDVYTAIFNRIGPKGLSVDLFLYSSGLFSVLGYAAMSVRPVLLEIYEKYYLALGKALLPALHGLVLGLLPGLEDGSEHTDQIYKLLDKLCAQTDTSAFHYVLWQCILDSSSARLPALTYLLSKINRKGGTEDQSIYLGENLSLVTLATCSALLDHNVLVERAALDVVSSLFPFHQPVLLPSDTTVVLAAALQTLLKRDASLVRRLCSWLQGTYFDKLGPVPATTAGEYFDLYTREHLLAAVRRLISQAALSARYGSKAAAILPYRLLRVLMERPEIGGGVVQGVLLELVLCFKGQVDGLGAAGVGSSPSGEALGPEPAGPATTGIRPDDALKKFGKKGSLRSEIVQSAHLFFNSLGPAVLWEWVCGLVHRTLSGAVEGEEPSLLSSSSSLRVDRCKSPSALTKGLSVSVVTGLLKFLLKALPLDSMENVHHRYLPHLLLVMVEQLANRGLDLPLSDLFQCLELALLIQRELRESPSSRSTTPHTPSTPLFATGLVDSSSVGHLARQDSSLADSASAQVDKGQQLEIDYALVEVRNSIREHYLRFFEQFLGKDWCAVEGREAGKVMSAADLVVRSLSKDVQCCYEATYKLLLQIHVYGEGGGGVGYMEMVELPVPIIALMDKCCGSQGQHLTFVAMETLFKVMEASQMVDVDGENDRSKFSVVFSSSITNPAVVGLVKKRTDFLQHISTLLWSCLSSQYTELHVQAATYLSWLHSLITPLIICERTILEDFATQTVAPYQRFSSLWQYAPLVYSQTTIRPFRRALMRMLEGLQSQDAAVHGFISSWVKFRLQKSDLDRLLHPLLRILQEADLKRASFEAARPKVEQHSKYFYESLSKAEGSSEDVGESLEPSLVYTQVYDASQVLFALSVLQSTITVDSREAIVTSLGEAVVDLRNYRGGSPTRCDALLVAKRQESVTKVLGTREHTAQRKTLLEFVLSSCVVFLQSEYPLSGEVSQDDLVANNKVKIAAAELIVTILHEFVGILGKVGKGMVGGGSAERVRNPSYVSALVTLCEVQKVGLLQLASTLRSLREEYAVTSSHPSVDKGADLLSSSLGERAAAGRSSLPMSVLEPYFVQLLKLVQQLVVLDTLCLPGSSLPPPPPSSPSSLVPPQNSRLDPSHQFVPSYPTAAQPLFHSVLLDTVGDLSLLPLHRHTLDMATSLLPHVPVNMEDLVPRLITKLCTNLGLLLGPRGNAEQRDGGERWEEEDKMRESQERRGGVPQLSGEVVVAYLRSLTSLIHFCILGVAQEDSTPCSHQELSIFRDLVPVCDVVAVAATYSPASLQPSPMAWLFGFFSGTQKGSEGVRDEQLSKMGLQGLGQTVLVLLSKVYAVLADLWAHFRWSGDHACTGTQNDSALAKKCRVEFEDVVHLTVHLLQPLSKQLPIAFFTSVADAWSVWNVESNGRHRRETFIELAHHISILPLEKMVEGVRLTIAEGIRMSDFDSVSAKYNNLLHFLYKYISSTHQSSDELSSCCGVLIAFLKECSQLMAAPGVDNSSSSCQSVCMLTSILYVFVSRVTMPDAKDSRKERRDLQDIAHKLCEALSQLSAGVSSSSTATFPASPIVAARDSQPGVVSGGSTVQCSDNVGSTTRAGDAVQSDRLCEQTTAGEEGNRQPVAAELRAKQPSPDPKAPGMRALTLLSSVLSHFIDSMFDSLEKDRVHMLLKAVLYNVWPYLRNHSVESRDYYALSVKLLASLSSFQITRRSWSKETLELFLDNQFFVADLESLHQWKIVLDNLLTQDKATFEDLLSRVYYSQNSGVVNIFTSSEQDALNGARLLKRIAFIIFSGETDQYVSHLPDIQGKLSESLKLQRFPVACTQAFLLFRVLLIKCCSTNLMSFWPTMITELLNVLQEMEDMVALCPALVPHDKLQLYLSACKFLDAALALSPEMLPHFQFLTWGIGHVPPFFMRSKPLVILRLHKAFLKVATGEQNHRRLDSPPPYLRAQFISSIEDLRPFFELLATSSSQQLNLSFVLAGENSIDPRLATVEKILLQDFAEPAS